jgi:hypothetical protein
VIKLIYLLFAVFSGPVLAQSKLPLCPIEGIRSECFAELTYANGSRYSGEWLNNKWNGNGEVHVPKSDKTEGFTYAGEFKDGKIYGTGVMKYASGVILSGNITAGKGSGIYPGGKYEGNFQSYQRSGFGVYTYNDGFKYEGNWLAGKQEGKGTLTSKNGDKYEGLWKNASLEEGTVSYINGSVYKGPLDRLLPSGVGAINYADGSKYEGNFVGGKLAGKGVMTYANGPKFDGEWIDGKPLNGIMTYADKFKYVGSFKELKRHGTGILYNPDGSVNYSGLWIDDLPDRPSDRPPISVATTANSSLDTTEEEKMCTEIGFKKKSPPYANCVLELFERRAANKLGSNPDDAACRGYGFKPNSADYAACRQQIDIARQNANRQQSQFEEQNRLYEEQIAMQKKEIRRANNQRALDTSLRLLGGQSPADAVVSTGTGAPIRPTNSSNSQLIQMPNGRMMNCITNGGLTQCY